MYVCCMSKVQYMSVSLAPAGDQPAMRSPLLFCWHAKSSADLYMTHNHSRIHSHSFTLMQMADPAGPFAALAPRMHSYKTSKAALNMGERFLALNLRALLLYWHNRGVHACMHSQQACQHYG